MIPVTPICLEPKRKREIKLKQKAVTREAIVSGPILNSSGANMSSSTRDNSPFQIPFISQFLNKNEHIKKDDQLDQ